MSYINARKIVGQLIYFLKSNLLLSIQAMLGCLIFVIFMTNNLLHAEERSIFIAPVADVVWDFWLCESAHTGQIKTYSCRDYKIDGIHYRLFYKGGVSPKAVSMITNNNSKAKLTYLNQSAPEIDFEIAPPEGVPESAIHIGTGVCENENSQSVPCSLFRHAPARQIEIYHYMVFYNGASNNSLQIDAQKMGSNPDVMIAELAYQIGYGLLDTVCCQQKALAYLKYAYDLFPYFSKYRNAYQVGKLEAAPLEQDMNSLEIVGAR